MTRRLPKVTMRQINPSGTREPITFGGLFMMLMVRRRMMYIMTTMRIVDDDGGDD